MNKLINPIYYNRVKVIINNYSVSKMIINIVVEYHELLNSIMINRGLVFISRF